jgi:hypothetical protein
MRGIFQQYVSISHISQFTLNFNVLALKRRSGVDIRHTLPSLPGPCLATNNQYFHVVTEKKENGTALADRKGKSRKH